jgi:DNA-binding transcriptional LysR family regulator
MNFTLKQLQIFLGIVSSGSLIATAKQLQLTQPAVSMALADLENILGEKLFDRWGKRVEINQSGKMLLPIAKRIVAGSNEIELMFAADNHQGLLRLGASSTLAAYVAPLLLGRFHKKFPNIRINLFSGNMASTLHQLENYEIDIALIAGNPHHAEFEQQLLFHDDMAIFCSPTHPLASRKMLRVDDLLSAQWILREPGSWSRERLITALATHTAHLDVKMVLDNTEAIKQVVRLCPTISCLSRMAIAAEIADGKLLILPIADLDLTRSFHLVFDKKRHQSRVVTAFLSFCESFFFQEENLSPGVSCAELYNSPPSI